MSIGELVTRSTYFAWHLLSNWVRELLYTFVESLPLFVYAGTSKELHSFLYFLSNGPASACRPADIVRFKFYYTCIELKAAYYLHTGG